MAHTLSELDGLLYATVISVSGKCGFMKHKHDLPPPYNHNKIVQFVTPDGILNKSLKKGQQAVFTVDKDSQKKLVAKDVAFVHTSYDPKTTIPYVAETCDHICFRNKAEPESVISCQKECSRKLTCAHACPKKCIEKCPEECKKCRKKNKCGTEKSSEERKDQSTQGLETKKEEHDGTYTIDDLEKEMQGRVIHLTYDYGFIQPTRNLPATFKQTAIYFNLSEVKKADTITLGSFVSFKMNVKCPDRPYAKSVRKIQKDSVKGFSEEKPYTLSELDGMLFATIDSVAGKYGFMKPMQELPPPYNHNRMVQFKNLNKSHTKGQQVVFTLDKDSEETVVAKDFAIVHTTYDPKKSIPCVGDSCDHICFRKLAEPEGEILCQKKCGRNLICTHACRLMCFEKCPENECKKCRIKNKNAEVRRDKERKKRYAQGDSEGTYTEKDLKKEMQGQVVHLTEDYGFIQPTRNVPATFKRTSIYFNLSQTKEADTITLRSFVSFKMNMKCPHRPYAVLVQKIQKDSLQEFSEKKACTPSDLDGLLHATIDSVNGKYGFMKPMRDLPPPYHHQKLVQFVTPDGILDRSFTKGQQVVFILDKDSRQKLVAKDVAFVHASYDPTTTIPYVGDLCDHICFRNKDDKDGVISCQKDCSRKLICTHACAKKCSEKCPQECKKCKKKNKSG